MKKTKSIIEESFFWILVTAMWIALYWRQCVIDNLNDFYCHNLFAKLIIDGKLILVYPGYHIPVGIIAKITGIDTTEASVFVLTFAQILSIIVTANILKTLSDKWKSRMQLLRSSFLLNIVQPIFFYNYKPGASSGNGLFSPTLTMVKPFTLLVIFLFFLMYRTKEYTIKRQICFFMSMIITAFVKPMFLMAFVPAAGILLLLEFFNQIKNRNISLNRELFYFLIKLIPLFLTGLVLIGQYVFSANYEVPVGILPEDVKLSSDGDSHIRIGFMRSWSLAVDNVYVSLIFTYLFPIVVLTMYLLYTYKKQIVVTSVRKNTLKPFKDITVSYGIISFLIMAFFYQEGREIDMNFRNAWVVTFNLVYILSYIYISELSIDTKSMLREKLHEKYSYWKWLKYNPIFVLAHFTWFIHIMFGVALITKYIVG